MRRERLKYGVIGAGSMGRHHIRIVSTLPGVQLTAVAEPNDEQAKSVPDILKKLIVKDYKEILSKVDAISIVTPTATHLEIGLECLDAGKHLLIEKPLAINSEQAQQLVDSAKEKNLILAVGLIERFNPAYKELGKLIKKEKIIGINIQRFSPFPDRITDANVIQDMMIHDLDLLVNLLPKDEIEEIKAEGKKVQSKKLDRVSATIFFRSGIIAKVAADRVFGIKTRKISVTTEKDIIEADLLNRRINIRDLQTHVPSVHHIKAYDQLTAELKDFVSAIKNEARPAVDGLAGLKATKLAEEVESKCS
ncbi:Gfo/Idh/MocA family protein [Candidatus Margulisiibacteriota bacterium]